jgi:hypothetical protein
VYSAITIDRGGQTHQGWRSFRFQDGQLHQTIFYLHHARHDEHGYALRSGEYAWGPDLTAIDDAARKLLSQLIDDADGAAGPAAPGWMA